MNEQFLFKSRDEAHAELLDVVGEVLVECRERGTYPSEAQFLRYFTRAWKIWQTLAPPA